MVHLGVPRRRSLRAPAAALVMALATGAAACGGSDGGSDGGAGGSGGSAEPASPAPAAFAQQRPAWSACRGLPTRPPGGTPSKLDFECATVRVPLDHARPGGETIGLAVIRARAADRRARIGSLLFNFGGPGASGVDTLPRAADDYTELNTRYDLVSFDPRGVGRSAPVKCLDDRQMDAMLAQDSSPDDDAEIRRSEKEQQEYVRSCERNSGRVLPYVGTPDAARDMDVLRAVLGDQKLNYFGISYGTWLGGGYAHLFPGNVGRAVLDGPVDTKISSRDLGLQQAAAFQRALDAFAADCARRGPRQCPLGQRKDAVVGSVRTLLDGLDARPLPASDGRRLTQGLGTTGVLAALYAQELWPLLAQSLVQAKEGDGSLLLSLADQQAGREPDGHYSNLNAANTAITCADTTDRYTTDDVRDALPKFRNASPVFGPSMAWGMLACTGWPVEGDEASQEIGAPDANRSLVLGNTGDPATPYAWAPAFAKELGSGELVTLRGQGHGSYDTGDACVRQAVNGYLLNGTAPPAGTTCPR